MLTAHDMLIAAGCLGALGAFVAGWLWAGGVIRDIPASFEADDFWGL